MSSQPEASTIIVRGDQASSQKSKRAYGIGQRRQVTLPGTRISLDPFSSTLYPERTLQDGGTTGAVTSTDMAVEPLPRQTTTTMTSAVGSRMTVTDTSLATPTGVSSDPNFTFGTMPYTMDTCGSTTVGWDYIGADCNITLLVSPTVLPNPGGVSSSIVGLVIGQDVDAASDSFSWSPVNLTAGRYVLRATGPNIAAESTIFTIVNGTDTSCLSGVPAHSPPSTVKPVAGGTGTNSTTTQTSFIPSNTAPLPPSPSPTRRPHPGTIAGGILGGVGVLAAALVVAVAYLRRRRARPLGRAGERDREKASAARTPNDFEGHSCPLASQASIVPLSKRPPLEPNRRPSSVASTPPAPQPSDVQLLAYVGGKTLSHGPSIASPTLLSARSEFGSEADPFGDGLSVSSRIRSYRTSGSNISGVGLLGSPAPSSATSQMYRGRDSAGSVWTYWRSLRGDRESRILNGTSSAHSLEDLSTMPPLQIAEGATFPDGC